MGERLPRIIIADCGVPHALATLMPTLVHAGEIALTIQEGLLNGSIVNSHAKEGDRATAALTQADLLIESVTGARILTTISDARFFGEEGVLKGTDLFPASAPYLITLDPVNGTLYFRSGVQQWNIVLTISHELEMLGAVVYLPYADRFYVGIRGEGAFITDSSRLVRGAWRRFRLPEARRAVEVLKGPNAAHAAAQLSVRGYGIVDIDDFQEGDRTWDQASQGILTGTLCGLLRENADFIDNVAIAMIAAEAGGFTFHEPVNPDTLQTPRLIFGATKEVFEDIRSYCKPS